MSKLLGVTRTLGLLVLMASIIGCAGLDTEVYQPSLPEGVAPTRVKAVIVEAHKSAYEEYNHKLRFPLCCYPAALLLFSTDQNKSTLALRELSREISALKGTVQSDEDKQLMADEVTDETYVEHRFIRVPSSISGDNSTYLAHAILVRDNFPGGHKYAISPSDTLICDVYISDDKPRAIRHVGTLEN